MPHGDLRHKRQEDRLRVIESSLARAHFGHLPEEMAAWAELKGFVDGYVAALRPEEEEAGMRELRRAMERAVKGHPLAERFPVSPAQRARTERWVREALGNQDVAEGITTTEEPEFVFKSYERATSTSSGGVFVTLLEENRELIGRGTTGLTSWQGALFMADWAQNQGQELLQVSYYLVTNIFNVTKNG